MAGLSADRLEQQGATGDGFAMMSRISQTDEQIPPVEHQRDAAGHQAAAAVTDRWHCVICTERGDYISEASFATSAEADWHLRQWLDDTGVDWLEFGLQVHRPPI